MALYQVQIESQARTVYTEWEGGALERATPLIVRTDFGQTYAEVLEGRSFMAPRVSHVQTVSMLRLATEEDRKNAPASARSKRTPSYSAGTRRAP